MVLYELFFVYLKLLLKTPAKFAVYHMNILLRKGGLVLKSQLRITLQSIVATLNSLFWFSGPQLYSQHSNSLIS